MIQISTTAPANWPGATTPLNAPVRPVSAVTPVLPVGAATSTQTDEDPARTRRRGAGDARPTTDAGEIPREKVDAAARQADVQALAEQRRAEQEAREAQEQADREAIERLRQGAVRRGLPSQLHRRKALDGNGIALVRHLARLRGELNAGVGQGPSQQPGPARRQVP